MKAERKEEKSFVPIIITIESQDEFDKIYAPFNHMDIGPALDGNDIYTILSRFAPKDGSFSQYHHNLNGLIKRTV